MPVREGVIDMRADTVAPCWIVAPRSHLVDRMTARLEEIRMPGRVVDGGSLAYSRERIVAAQPVRGRKAWLSRRLAPAMPAPEHLEDAGLIVDLRRRNPENWAHFLTNHLPYVFTLAEANGVDWSDLTLLLPEKAPRHVVEAAALFGFHAVRTDRSVAGEGIAFAARPWGGNRGVRADWVRAPRVATALSAALAAAAPGPALPRRVFISRRDSRRLVNEAEIAAHLAGLGLETVYAEDLSVPDQFRLLARAEMVVAIHGAALAPLLYRPEGAPPATVVELMPVGHVTLVWRIVAQQVGCRWAGVRGRIRAEHIAQGLYDLDDAFLRFSTEDFEVDPASIDRAIELAV
jgi:capsular polysaccharide biosynthesis protein